MDDTPPNDGLQGLDAPVKRKAFGYMDNAQRQHKPGFLEGAPYELAIVEFDDEGRCYDRAQMRAVADRFDTMRVAGKDAIVLVFVHGWKHDARTDDPNLCAFRRLLKKTAEFENGKVGASARPVLGIFVGWRGLTAFGLKDAVSDVTFWDRQSAGQRVATGSVRELFGRLRHYRNHQIKHGGAPMLAIAGHSFGGMIVFSALAQSLIEAASAPAGHVIPSLGDLVLLVNPAIEAARFLPIYDLVKDPAFAARTTKQLPVFVLAQAINDGPVGKVFPLGNAYKRLDQATIGDLEQDCVVHAMGFVPAFQTHTLAGPSSAKPFMLTPPDVEQIDPFWVVEADAEVINGHGGIWQEPFIAFLASILFQHVEASSAPKNDAPEPPPSVPPGPPIIGHRSPMPASEVTTLADYAKSLGF